jgi:hypothetical protein
VPPNQAVFFSHDSMNDQVCDRWRLGIEVYRRRDVIDVL